MGFITRAHNQKIFSGKLLLKVRRSISTLKQIQHKFIDDLQQVACRVDTEAISHVVLFLHSKFLKNLRSEKIIKLYNYTIVFINQNIFTSGVKHIIDLTNIFKNTVAYMVAYLCTIYQVLSDQWNSSPLTCGRRRRPEIFNGF